MSKKSKIISIIIVALLFISGGIYYFNTNYIYTDTIANNISIEGVDVSLLTKDEAINKLNQEIVPDNIILEYDNKEYILTPTDIELSYNIEDIVEEGFKYTKTDDYFTNIERFFKLIQNKENLELKLNYNESKLSSKIEELSTEVNVKMKNADIYISASGNKNISSSVEGVELDIIYLKEKIYESIVSKDFSNIEVKVNKIQPNVSTQDVKSINTVLGQYSTKFSSSNENRSYNIYLSAKSTSDVLLMPGEEFSYNNLTGKRTISNGYKDAPIIINGEMDLGIGGGVCQVSSTIFNSAMYSGLDITTRQNHSLKSSYVPVGQDAMVTDSWSDFKFVNNFSYPVYIKNIYSDGVITSKVYGNSGDKKNISVRVERIEKNGKVTYKTYRDYLNSSGKVISSQHVDNSVYKD